MYQNSARIDRDLLLLRRYHAGLLDGDLASGERIHDRHMSARFEILEGGQAAVTRLQRREPIEVHNHVALSKLVVDDHP